jgi:kumamolisin
MALPQSHRAVDGADHIHPEGHVKRDAVAPSRPITVTLFLRRRSSNTKLHDVKDFSAASGQRPRTMARQEFTAVHGAQTDDIEKVAGFARNHGLKVEQTNSAARSVVLSGPAEAMNRAFSVQLHEYDSPLGAYHGHEGTPKFSPEIADVVEGITGLDSRRVPAQHYSAARRRNHADPANTRLLTPQKVASLYNFPAGTGAGQTIGIYEMETQDGPAGYDPADIAATMAHYGLPAPSPVDVAVDGIQNSGISDGETGLDITLAGAVAPDAKLAVYFTGGTVQSIIHALQRMIHPSEGDPAPTILSISYGWGPDDASAHSFSRQEYNQIGALFQDAANLDITVLVSSGDSGAVIASQSQAQASYPSTEPWVIACGGTTIGNISGTGFDEYVWNDVGAAGPGATGGGISARFALPDYQKNAGLPLHLHNNKSGRGIPDIAGNASQNSGYLQFIGGQSGPVGGTSAVAPLYSGLIARINQNLARSVGFINPVLYTLPAAAFRDITSPPGPRNNSFANVAGYPAGIGWDACTGLGSLNGEALQAVLATANEENHHTQLEPA